MALTDYGKTLGEYLLNPSYKDSNEATLAWLLRTLPKKKAEESSVTGSGFPSFTIGQNSMRIGENTLNGPNVDLGAWRNPSLTTTELPGPSLTMPSVDIPGVTTPTMPNLPNTTMPNIPTPTMPNIPTPNIPSGMPTLDTSLLNLPDLLKDINLTSPTTGLPSGIQPSYSLPVSIGELPQLGSVDWSLANPTNVAANPTSVVDLAKNIPGEVGNIAQAISDNAFPITWATTLVNKLQETLGGWAKAEADSRKFVARQEALGPSALKEIENSYRQVFNETGDYAPSMMVTNAAGNASNWIYDRAVAANAPLGKITSNYYSNEALQNQWKPQGGILAYLDNTLSLWESMNRPTESTGIVKALPTLDTEQKNIVIAVEDWISKGGNVKSPSRQMAPLVSQYLALKRSGME